MATPEDRPQRPYAELFPVSKKCKKAVKQINKTLANLDNSCMVCFLMSTQNWSRSCDADANTDESCSRCAEKGFICVEIPDGARKHVDKIRRELESMLEILEEGETEHDTDLAINYWRKQHDDFAKMLQREFLTSAPNPLSARQEGSDSGESVIVVASSSAQPGGIKAEKGKQPELKKSSKPEPKPSFESETESVEEPEPEPQPNADSYVSELQALKDEASVLVEKLRDFKRRHGNTRVEGPNSSSAQRLESPSVYIDKIFEALHGLSDDDEAV